MWRRSCRPCLIVGSIRSDTIKEIRGAEDLGEAAHICRGCLCVIYRRLNASGFTLCNNRDSLATKDRND